MNYSLAVLLLNDNCRAIEAIYEPDPADDKRPKAKRELFKSFDATIAVGDIVCVPSTTRHCVTTVKVTDTDVEWDVNTPGEVKWVIGKIEQSAYDSMRAQETAAITQIKESEKTHARNELKAKMFAHMDAEQMKALQISPVPVPAIARAP